MRAAEIRAHAGIFLGEEMPVFTGMTDVRVVIVGLRSDNPEGAELDPRNKSEGDGNNELSLAPRCFERLIIRDDLFRVGVIVAEGGTEDFDGALKVGISLVWFAMLGAKGRAPPH